MVVKKGVKWRVGTSANIPLFSESWIKNGLFLSIDSLIHAPLTHVKVIDIIDQSNKV